MIEETVKANLRSDMFRNLLKQDMCFFDDERNSAGSLASRLASDTKLAAGGFGVSLAVQVQAACCGVVSLSMALWYCWQLTFALIGTLPIGIIAEIYADNLQTRAAAKAQDGARERLKCSFSQSDCIPHRWRCVPAAAQATSIATEAISAFSTVATFQMQEPVVKMYEEAVSVSDEQGLKATLAGALVFAIGMAMNFVVPAVALLYGGEQPLASESSRWLRRLTRCCDHRLSRRRCWISDP